MSKVKPFKYDLAAWCIEYLQEQVACYGLTTEIRVRYDETGLIVQEYYLLYRAFNPVGEEIHGASACYRPSELEEMYHHEVLDMSAHRFAHWVRRKIEEMGNG